MSVHDMRTMVYVANDDPNAAAVSPHKAPLDSLTSLRFFAAMAVVVFHLKPVMPSFFQPVRAAYLYDRLACGVGFFFVLSGFVLYYNYGRTAKLGLKEFYIKRWARIYPLHLLTFTVWCALFYSSWGTSQSNKLLSGLANLTLTQSLFPGGLFCLGFNAVSWSLSNEAFFYAVFPWVRRTRVCMAALGTIGGYLVLAYVLGFQDSVSRVFPNIEYFFAPLRLAEFCAGIFIAKLFCQQVRLPHATLIEVSVLAAVVFNVCFQDVAHYSLGQLSYLPTFAALIWVFAHQQGAVSRALARQRTLVFLGECSFALYMWHHLIMKLCQERFPTATPAWLAISAAIGVSLAISIASFKWFEDPMRKLLAKALLGRGERAVENRQPQTDAEGSVRAAA